MTGNAQQLKQVEQFLTFELAGEAYGIEILKVQEIRGWEPVRKIPDAPSYLKGALNLRGSIVPIIDLRERFHMEAFEYTPTTVVIVISVENETTGRSMMGIVADAVSDVLDIDLTEVKPAPNLGQIDTRYMRGMYVGKKTMIMLLNVDKLIKPEEFIGISDLSDTPETK